MDSTPTPRALAAVDCDAPNRFRVCFAGAWGFETNGRLSAVLSRVPLRSTSVDLDCRRITLIDGKTMSTMTDFADACAKRAVGVTFECDDDPVSRLISICGLDRLVVAYRPLRATGTHRS